MRTDLIVIIHDKLIKALIKQTSAHLPIFAKKTMNILCIGDSITFGYDMADGLSYPSQLQLKLPSYTVYNKGINGDTSQGVLSRLQSEVKETQAAHVLLCIGINDLCYGLDSKMIVANMLTTLRHIKYYKAIPVLILGPNFAFSRQNSPRISSHYSNQVLYKNYEELLEQLHDATTSMGIDAIDCRNALQSSDFLEDGLHPNERGYEKISEHIQQYFSNLSL